jgi:hypothetical protein
MTPNRKLTDVIKGRIFQGFEVDQGEVSPRFADGSILRVKGRPLESSWLKNSGLQAQAVSEESATLYIARDFGRRGPWNRVSYPNQISPPKSSAKPQEDVGTRVFQSKFTLTRTVNLATST